jgi:hypothetical protein
LVGGFVKSPLAWAGVVAGLVAYAPRDSARVRWSRYSVPATCAVLMAVVMAGLLAGLYDSLSYAPYCVLVGAAMWGVRKRAAGTLELVAGPLVIGAAAAVSVGMPAPGLAIAATVAWLACDAMQSDLWTHSRAARRSFAVLAVGVLVSFCVARFVNVDGARSALELTRGLGSILPGGALVRVSVGQAEYLEDLGLAQARAGGNAPLLGYVPIYWALSGERNQLPVDWPYQVEVANPRVYEWLVRSVREHAADGMIVVMKRPDFAGPEAQVAAANWDNDYRIVGLVRSEMRLVGQTRYFELYTSAPTQ